MQKCNASMRATALYSCVVEHVSKQASSVHCSGCLPGLPLTIPCSYGSVARLVLMCFSLFQTPLLLPVGFLGEKVLLRINTDFVNFIVSVHD
mmetsp:Transcript_28743/g.56466  ORF Transcript_28743/g.56466 Transcript_28743/m.56466 type:complete len:92 (+) Transcript_28743:365-640(+)